MKKRGLGIILSYVNTILNAVCGLFLSVFLIQTLGDTEYGLYQIMGSFVSYLVLFEFGTGNVMTRNIAMCRAKGGDEKEFNSHVSTVWTITNLLTVLILVVSYLFFVSIEYIYDESLTTDQITYGKQIFLILVLYLIVSFYQQTLKGFLLGCEQYTFGVVATLIKVVVRTIVLLVLIYFVRYAILIAVVDVIIESILLLVTYLYSKKTFAFKWDIRCFDRKICFQILPFCLAVFLQAIVNQANNNVDKFILGIKLGPEIVAVYSVAMYIFSVFSMITTIPISMYLPKITQDVNNGVSTRELATSLIRPCRMLTLIGGMIFWGFVSVGREFISIVYGPKYTVAWIIAIIVMGPMLLNMAIGVLVNVLDAMNKRMARSKILAVTTALNVILTVIWIDQFGMMGAPIATAVSTLIGQVTLMNIYYVKKMQLPVLYMYKEAFKGILPSQMFASVVTIILTAQIDNEYVSFFVGGLAFVCIALTGCYLKKIRNNRGCKQC